MIIYQAKKKDFLDDVLSNDIENIILRVYKKKIGKQVAQNELRSWKNSMMYMNTVLLDNDIPDESGILIEYHIPQTSKRIDFIITGLNEEKKEQAILIELKQWETATLSSKDGLVSTFINAKEREAAHPSYQAWSYAELLQNFNETVYTENISLNPCAYLHNYSPDEVIRNAHYSEYLEKAPVFLKNDLHKLRDFIKRFVKYGDQANTMYRIDGGKIKPSKSLADSVASMIKDNREFIMIDEQKVVYETALELAIKSSKKDKHVLIVQGGPGTGKSVVAINLLANIINKHDLNARYVTKNAAPRAVYESKLTGTLKKTVISNLFTGSGAFVNAKENEFDVLIVDEAHRLNEKSGMFKNLGDNQVREIIRSSMFSIFFVDEDQKVTLHDIGDKEEIIKWARREGATIHESELTSQFRCNGSDGYLAWLDNILQIRETANYNLDQSEYEFKIVDSPNELRDLIFEKNKTNNKARMVAGYCWPWNSKKDKEADDIVFPQYKFGMKWNLSDDGNLWIIKPESVNEIGCIHTCQGLELDYVGVIIGPDFIVREDKVITDASMRAKTDSSTRTYKSEIRKDPDNAPSRIDAIIKNTYRTLMTRGMKGCYVYFTDAETEEYFKLRVATSTVYKIDTGFNIAAEDNI